LENEISESLREAEIKKESKHRKELDEIYENIMKHLDEILLYVKNELDITEDDIVRIRNEILREIGYIITDLREEAYRR